MRRAVHLYEKFNRRPARSVHSKSVSITPELVDLGPCIAVAYASTKEGAARHYEHKCGPGVRLYATADGKTLIISGGRLRVTDWIRG